jgi:hypothetical protein
MSTVLTKQQVKQIQGKCSGCFHAAPGVASAPGASSVCGLCFRNASASKDTAVKSDDGRLIYGLRDCYIAKDRFTMELRGETFLQGVHTSG